MEEYTRFAVTIVAFETEGDVEGTRAFLAVDTSSGTARVSTLTTTALDPDIDVRQFWGRVDFDAIAAEMPKGGNTIYEQTAAAYQRIAAEAVAPPPEPVTPAAIEAPVAPQPPAELAIPQVTRVTVETERARNHVEAIYLFLHGGIADGLYPVGGKIPTRRELLERFPEASSHSAQRALRLLQEDGLVVSNGAAGTKVLRRPKNPARRLVETSAPSGGTEEPSRRQSAAQARRAAELAELPVVDPNAGQ